MISADLGILSKCNSTDPFLEVLSLQEAIKIGLDIFFLSRDLGTNYQYLLLFVGTSHDLFISISHNLYSECYNYFVFQTLRVLYI